MEYIGISEFNYNPIEQFNNSLKNTRAFEIPQDEKAFDAILESKRNPEKNDMDKFMTKVSGAFSDGLNNVSRTSSRNISIRW